VGCIYKIVSKVLANKLKMVLEKIISTSKKCVYKREREEGGGGGDILDF
jgi:hypothetical protein